MVEAIGRAEPLALLHHGVLGTVLRQPRLHHVQLLVVQRQLHRIRLVLEVRQMRGAEGRLNACAVVVHDNLEEDSSVIHDSLMIAWSEFQKGVQP